jgi:hypothetical protein
LNERTKVFWHEAFFEALQLEFHRYQGLLEFKDEYPLSKEALIMDVLLIKKKPGERIEKNIGRIFKTHNVFEFKSETDSLTEHDYNKVVAYALLYSSFTPAAVSDITVSFAVTVHPRELLKYLKDERRFTIHTAEDGIYYIDGDTFPVQILENKLLPPNENLFLRNLRSNLSTDEVTKTAEAYTKIKPFEKKNVYLDRLMQANRKSFKEAVDMMSDAAREIIIEAVEESSWLAKRDLEKVKAIAKKMLLDGESIDKIVNWTELPYETVISLA